MSLILDALRKARTMMTKKSKSSHPPKNKKGWGTKMKQLLSWNWWTGKQSSVGAVQTPSTGGTPPNLPTLPDNNPNPEGESTSWLVIVTLVVFLVLITTAQAMQYFGDVNNLVRITFYLEIVYVLLSLKSVGPTELGALLLFGKPLIEVGSGLILVPFGFFSLVTETALTMQDQFPGDPEKVQKTSSDELEPGKVFPIRATHAAAKQKSDDAIDIRMTTEVSVISREKIMRGYFITFLITIGSTKEMRRQIRDTVEGAIKKEFAQRTPAETLADLSKIDEVLKKAVKDLTESWGIEVINVQIIDIDLGKTVNEALRNVTAARLAKQKTITDSEAERTKITNVGIGTADAKKRLLEAEATGRRLSLEAEAIGTTKLAEIAKTSEGQIVLWLEAIRAGFEKANHTIIPGGDFFSAVANISTLMDKTKGVTK